MTIGKEVAGKVTCTLTDVTARVALETFLRSNGYDFVPMDGVLVVVPAGEVADFVPVPPVELVQKTFRLPYTGTEGNLALDESGTGAGAPAGGKSVEETIRAMLSPRGKMAYYAHQHLLMLEDEEKVAKMVEAFVKNLWATPLQVFIDAKLVEVTLEQGEDLGLRWSVVQKISKEGANSQVAGGADTLGTTIESTAPTLGLDRAFTYGIVNANINVVLEALGTLKRVDLRSSPRVLVMNHRPASIIVGQEIPYLSSQQAVGGGESPIRTYEFKEVAVRLDVTPHISDDSSTIWMDVHPSVKSVVGYTDAPKQPILSVREAVTNVAVGDGATLIIGGLVQRNISKTRSETPGIARIPLIGLLFQQHSTQDTQNDLLFLLSPRVVTPEMMRELIDSKESLFQELPPHKGEPKADQPDTQ
jgi:general secretion pathway protein D